MDFIFLANWSSGRSSVCPCVCDICEFFTQSSVCLQSVSCPQVSLSALLMLSQVSLSALLVLSQVSLSALLALA